MPQLSQSVSYIVDNVLLLFPHSCMTHGLMCCSNHSLEWHLWYANFSKALSRLSSSRDYKRTQQRALTALLLYLYKYNVVHATTMCLLHVLLLIHYKATMPYTCALMSYSLISVTMYVPYVYHEELMSLDVTPNPNSDLDFSQSF